MTVSIALGNVSCFRLVSGAFSIATDSTASTPTDVSMGVNARVTALHIAGKHGHVNVAALLIDKGADVNAKDKWLWTPLHYACWKNRKETVEFLLVKGADLNTKDEDDKTPLAVAEKNGHSEILELLRKHGAKE